MMLENDNSRLASVPNGMLRGLSNLLEIPARKPYMNQIEFWPNWLGSRI